MMIRIYIYLIVLTLTVVGCDNPKESISEDSLECLLSIYLDNRPQHLDGEIFVSYVEGWTDSTAILRILTVNTKKQKLEGKLFVSNFSGNKILLEVGKFGNGTKVIPYPLNEFHVPNDLEWKEIRLNTENQGNSNPEFAEVQLEYRIKDECIQDVIMGNEYEHMVTSKCKVCK